MASREGALLLDTHVWIWFVEGARGELSSACARAIEEARTGAGAFVSALSVREVAVLVARRRLDLAMDAAVWVRRALDPLRLQPLPLSVEAAELSARLPGRFHRDPADQMLVASALVHGLTLVTRDQGILDYGREGHVATMDAAQRGS